MSLKEKVYLSYIAIGIKPKKAKSMTEVVMQALEKKAE